MNLMQKLTKELQDCTHEYGLMKQERDVALARVKELEDALAFEKTSVSIGILIADDLRTKYATCERQIDTLSDDLQCAKLASELASKEREALRQLVRDCRELVMDGNYSKVRVFGSKDAKKLADRAAELLGEETQP